MHRPGEASQGFVVRPALPADLPRVLPLAPRLLEGMPPWRQTAATLRAAEGWLAASLAPPTDGEKPRAAFVAEAAGDIVGVAGATAEAHFSGIRQAYLGELAVAREWEGRGVGRALVAAIEEWAAACGMAEIALVTGSANGRARDFYAMLGYEDENVGLVKRLVGPTGGDGEGRDAMAAGDDGRAGKDKDWSRVATGETLHLVPEPHWRAHDGADRYAPEPFAEEGFIHTTHGEDRLLEVANRFYRSDPRAYLVLTVDLGRVDAPVIYEDPDDAFPHVYGHLPVGAVVAVRRVERGPDGAFLGIGEDAAETPVT